MTIEYKNITHLGHDKNWTVAEALAEIQNNGETAWALADSKLVMQTATGHEEISFTGTDIQTLIQNGTAKVEVNGDGTIDISPTDAGTTVNIESANVKLNDYAVISPESTGGTFYMCSGANPTDGASITVANTLTATTDPTESQISRYEFGTLSGTIMHLESAVNTGQVRVNEYGSDTIAGTAKTSVELNGDVSLLPPTGSKIKVTDDVTINTVTEDGTKNIIITNGANAVTGNGITIAENSTSIGDLATGNKLEFNYLDPYAKITLGSSVVGIDDALAINTNSEAQYDADGTNLATVNKAILEAKLGNVDLEDVLSADNNAGELDIVNVGNFALGTTSTVNNLNIFGADSDGTSSSGNAARIGSSVNGINICGDDTGNRAVIQTISGDELALNAHGGNVGIGLGSTAPSQLLDVDGVIASQATNAQINTAGDRAVITKEYGDDNYLGGGADNFFNPAWNLAEIVEGTALSDQIYASAWVAPMDFDVSDLYVFVTAGGIDDITVGIYSLDGNTLHASGSLSVTGTDTGVVKIPLSASYSVTGQTTYFLAAKNDGGVVTMGKRATFSNNRITRAKYDSTAGTMPTTLGTAADTSAWWIGAGN